MKETLLKKYGGVPAWAWAALAIVVLAWYMRRRKSAASTQNVTPVSASVGSQQNGAQLQGASGLPWGIYGPTGGTPPSGTTPTPATLQQRETEFLTQYSGGNAPAITMDSALLAVRSAYQVGLGRDPESAAAAQNWASQIVKSGAYLPTLLSIIYSKEGETYLKSHNGAIAMSPLSTLSPSSSSVGAMTPYTTPGSGNAVNSPYTPANTSPANQVLAPTGSY